MAIYFLDSSSAVKRYVRETGSTWLLGLADPTAGNSLYVARITSVETLSAITRRQRRGDISASDAASAIKDIRQDFETAYSIIETTSLIVQQAMNMAEKHGLRGYDAVQLATSIQVSTMAQSLGLPPVILVAADAELNTAALAEGLTVENPNRYL